jgi:hypothetical protein
MRDAFDDEKTRRRERGALWRPTPAAEELFFDPARDGPLHPSVGSGSASDDADVAAASVPGGPARAKAEAEALTAAVTRDAVGQLVATPAFARFAAREARAAAQSAAVRRRGFCAALCDAAALAAAAWLLCGGSGGSAAVLAASASVLFVLVAVLAAATGVGRTPGMRVCGLRVRGRRSLATPGRAVVLARAVLELIVAGWCVKRKGFKI